MELVPFEEESVGLRCVRVEVDDEETVLRTSEVEVKRV